MAHVTGSSSATRSSARSSATGTTQSVPVASMADLTVNDTQRNTGSSTFVEYDLSFTRDPDAPLNLITNNNIPPGLDLIMATNNIANHVLNAELGPRGRYLLATLAKVERGEIRGYHLGRMIRVSTDNQALLGQMYVTILEKIQKYPHLIAEYAAVAQQISRIQGYTSERNSMFEELPPEIRRMIYLLVLKIDRVIQAKTCNQPCHPRPAGRPKTSMALIYVNRMMYTEAAPLYYQINRFAFGCCCAMADHIAPNFPTNLTMALQNMTTVKFTWGGAIAGREKGIKILSEMPNLKNVEIIVNRPTYDVVSPRENFFQQTVFLRQRPAILSDISGMEELLLLRNLDTFDILFPPSLVSSKRREEVNQFRRFMQTLAVVGGSRAGVGALY